MYVNSFYRLSIYLWVRLDEPESILACFDLFLQETIAMPFASLMAEFREEVRKIALENRSKLVM